MELPPLAPAASQPSPALIATLPGESYVSDAIFAAEQERIFENMWFCAVGRRTSRCPAVQEGPGRP